MLTVHNLLLHYFIDRIRNPAAIHAQTVLLYGMQLCNALSPKTEAGNGMAREVQVVIDAATELHPDFIFLGYRTGLITLLTAIDLLIVLLSQAEKATGLKNDVELLQSEELSGLVRAFCIVAA